MCGALLNAVNISRYNIFVHFLWNTELWINTFRFRKPFLGQYDENFNGLLREL